MHKWTSQNHWAVCSGYLAIQPCGTLMCIKGKEVCQRLAGEKKDLVEHGPETVSTEFPLSFCFGAFLSIIYNIY